MSANNSTTLIGYVKNLEYDGTNQGKERAIFACAVRKNYKVKDGEKKYWYIRCQAWGRHAVNINTFIGEGGKIALVGHIVTGSYKKEDGTTVYTTDVKVDDIDLTLNPKEAQQAEQPAAQPAQQTAQAPVPPQQTVPQPQAQVPPAPAPQQMTTSQLQAAADQLSDEDIPF